MSALSSNVENDQKPDGVRARRRSGAYVLMFFALLVFAFGYMIGKVTHQRGAPGDFVLLIGFAWLIWPACRNLDPWIRPRRAETPVRRETQEASEEQNAG